MTHGDPKNPNKNPHPVKRYEVVATADAPGAWDTVQGSVRYEVVNLECIPKSQFVGTHSAPEAIWKDIPMSRVDEKTWKGYFYRDLFQDEDYYGLGVCHWDGAQVAPSFVVHGVTFGSSQMVDEALKSPRSDYFKKSDFLDRSPKPYGIQDFSAGRPEVVQNPEGFFPITVSVKEVTP